MARAPAARPRPSYGRRWLPMPERLAQAWAQAVADVSAVPMDRETLTIFLRGLAEDLLDALAADPFDRDVALGVGAALVDADFTEAGSMEHTVTLLDRQLAPVAAPDRLAALQGALAAGYAAALEGRTRREHEEISASASAARAVAEQARWDSEARFRTVLAESVIGIGLTDTDGRILEFNQAMADMLGHPEGTLTGSSIWTVVHPGDAPGTWDRIHELLAGERDHLRVEKVYHRPDGGQVWTDLVLSLVRDASGNPQHMVAMMENVTERHQLQSRLRYQALHDPLTDLPNRTLFFERLDAALSAGARPGVCYLDLDGFKAVNDTLGHCTGDTLLQTIARRLTDALGDEHLVARMGGDEFVVLTERDADDGRLCGVARTALDAVRKPVRLGDHDIVVSASVGVVRADGDRDAAELMKAADTTLYWAKADGRDRYAEFDAERHRNDVSRFELSARMPDALVNGEFHLEYQPLVGLTDRRMVGVEALLRWRLPDGRQLEPSRFVPLAEDTGFIVELGRWVLAQACRQAAAWAAADPSTRLVISVNVAARQVREPGLVDDVAAVLAETRWPPELLQLELTESALMGTPDGSLAALNALADMGVRIAIDDFGTGYSNFAYLRRLPVHALKLAGSFVTGAAGGDGSPPALGTPSAGADVDREVVEFVIRLAHTLGLTVTAESIETAAQFAHLQQLGCDTGQGWFFARPTAPEAIPPLLTGPLGDPATDR